jgi:CP family cyanate transporter-like MFS transporter
VLWFALTRREPAHVRSHLRPLRLPFRSAVGWRLVGAFLFMSAVVYGLNAWLPAVYVDRGWGQSSAGALLAVLNAIGIPTGFLVAWAADRWGSRSVWLTGAAAGQLAGLLGVIAVPSAGWLWAAVLGVAIGPLFPLTMTLPLDAAHEPAEVAALTGMMLGVGYTASAATPLLLGVIRDRTGSFDAVLWCIAAAAAALVVVDASLRLGGRLEPLASVGDAPS